MIAKDAFHGRRALVTGGLGFIGSNLAIRLVQLGAKVTVVDSLLPQFGGNIENVALVQDQLIVEQSDLRSSAAISALVEGQDYVFHLAAQISHGRSMRDPGLDLDVNCVATMNLVEACRKHNSSVRLLYASTRQVYGRPDSLPVTEDHPTVPVDVNGIHKLAAEHYHLLYHNAYGICSTVLRLTNTYGPRQQLCGDHHGFVPIFLRQALRAGGVRLFDGGRQLRDFNYVDDVVDAMLLAIRLDSCAGRVFNLGANRPYSLAEFVELLKQLCTFEVEHAPFPQDKRTIDIGDYYGDFTRLRDATGWRPRVDLAEGLRRTIDFYRTHKEIYWNDIELRDDSTTRICQEAASGSC